MKVKTAELTGPALDCALAMAEGKEFSIADNLCGEKRVWLHGGTRAYMHTDPATCMGLIDCEYGRVWKVEAIPRTTTPTVLAMGFSSVGADVTKIYGQTLAQAAARCVVAMRLGDEVSVPDELCGVQS